MTSEARLDDKARQVIKNLERVIPEGFRHGDALPTDGLPCKTCGRPLRTHRITDRRCLPW